MLQLEHRDRSNSRAALEMCGISLWSMRRTAQRRSGRRRERNTHMNLKLPATHCLVGQDFGKRNGQAVPEKSLACFTLHIESLTGRERARERERDSEKIADSQPKLVTTDRPKGPGTALQSTSNSMRNGVITPTGNPPKIYLSFFYFLSCGFISYIQVHLTLR